jgi:hypothetical protein
MKYIYEYEGRPVIIGDRIGEYTIADFSGDLVRVEEVLPESVRYEKYTNWAWARLLGVIPNPIPESGIFNRITGERISCEAGTVLPDGSTIQWFDESSKNIYCGIMNHSGLVSSTFTADSLTKMGLEIRHNMTADIIKQVPRFLRKGVTCIKVGRSFVPAEQAVWSRGEKKYIRLDNAVQIDLTWMSKDNPKLVQFLDGSYGMPGSGYAITGGPNAGQFVRNRAERAQCGDRWYPVVELIPVYYRDVEPWDYRLTEPVNDDGFEKVNGEWCLAGYSVTLADGSVCARHRAYRVLTGFRPEPLSGCTEEWILRETLEDVARYCPECGAWSLLSFMAGSECRSCAARSRTRIRNYSNNYANSLIPEEDIPIKFGIELEVGTDKGTGIEQCATTMADALSDREDFANYGVFKMDGSIQCGGFEVVTRPDSPAVHKRIWSKALAVPKVREQMSSWSNRYCGMHIHVSRAPLSTLWIGRILVTINSPDMSSLVTAVAGRGSMNYAQREDKRLTSGKSRYGDRYEAVNTTGQHTIEFRIFRGTLDPKGFVRNVEFVEAVLDFTRPASTSLRDIGKVESFVEFIKKSRKAYPVLFDFLTTKGFIDDPKVEYRAGKKSVRVQRHMDEPTPF